MQKIAVNHFNTLEFEPHKANYFNNQDRYFDVYLLGRNIQRELVAEVKINMFDNIKSSMQIKKKGNLIHPKVLLVLNKFIAAYKDEH